MSTRLPAEPDLCRLAPRWLWALLPLFAILVTANSGGYRFGISDQAFYIPAIDRAMVPALFPHDAALVEPQARLLLLDEAVARLARATGIGLPSLFLALYGLTVVLFGAGVLLVGTRLYRTWPASVALLLALTLRHRVTQTGVNTFEGYFHPRVLAFSVGLFVLAAMLQKRLVLASVLVGLAMLVHPTTGIWFGVVLLGSLVARPGGWRVALACAVAGTAAGLLVVTSGILGGALSVMDPAWTAAFASKDYLFPTAWPAGAWLVNAIAPAVLVGVAHVRARGGLVTDGERALLYGMAAIGLVFLASLPLSHARVAIAVQLQIPRVLWIVELVATAYLVWVIVDRTLPLRPVVAAGTIAILFVASSARGVYVLDVEHDRPLVRRDLPATPFTAVAEWAAAHTPSDASFVLDPDHAWKEDVSFRVAARRDVYLEAVKDAAMATYSREVAMRVADRTTALGDFATLTPARATALARRYDLDYLVANTAFDLPVVFRSGECRIYALRHNR